MFENFKPTRSEREKINKAFQRMDEICNSDFRNFSFMKQECMGYGNSNDRIPMIAAKGLCCKWFMKGVRDPEIELESMFMSRAAAIWFTGYGCRLSPLVAPGVGSHKIIQDGVDAYHSAYTRMMEANKRQIA